MNVKQRQARGRKIKSRTLRLREEFWPDVNEDNLWVRTKHQGFITAPRPLPMILQIMDAAAKGKPISTTYLALWCRVWDESVVTINSEYELALESGFSGQRATSTWRSRMRALQDLGFIDVKPGPKGPFNYVLIFNPYDVIMRMNGEGRVQEQKYNALYARAQEVGANDLTKDE